MKKNIRLMLILALVMTGCIKEEVPNNSTIPTDGLIAYYPFNGNVNDESGKGNNGTIIGGVTSTSDRHGNANSAMQFNGTNGYISIPNSQSLQSPSTAITIAGWIYIESFTSIAAAALVSKSVTSNYGQYILNYHEWSDPHRLGFTTTTANLGAVASINLALNQWHFIASTYNGSKVTFYTDGNMIGETACSGSMIPDSNPLTLGLDSPGDTEYLQGKLDEIAIYNRALSAQEIQILFNR